MTETWADVRPVAIPGSLGLRVLSYARWPQTEDDTLPQIAGFIVSSFNPLVAEVADRCLRNRNALRAPREAGADDDAAAPNQTTASRTALVLASVGGDRATAGALAEAVRTERRVPPLLFFQSNPNAVLGHIAARHRLTGPLVCISPPMERADGIPAAALVEADLLLRDGDADEVLLIAAEQGAAPGERDRAEAVLVDRGP
jgi:hypothetical protein